ncbi:MAG: hypothetical protein NVSMB9_21950 [Isosphaeraceae bacterium]
MPVSYLPFITPLLLVGVPLLLLAKGKRAALVASATSAFLTLLLILSVYAPGWLLRADRENPAALYELARWKENHGEQISAVLPWPCQPDVLGGYALLEQAAARNDPPAVWLVGVRLKYGIHVPEPPNWTGPGGNVFPQPERGQRMIDRAIALGFQPPPDEENYYGRVYRTGNRTPALLLPTIVWLGVVFACSLVGASLGSLWPGSSWRDPLSTLGRLAIIAGLIGYAAAWRFLLSRVVEMNYWPPALQWPAIVFLLSLGLEAAISKRARTQHIVLGGSLIGLATTLCAVGPGIVLAVWLIPIFPDAVSIVTCTPTFAGAIAAYRHGRKKLHTGTGEV